MGQLYVAIDDVGTPKVGDLVYFSLRANRKTILARKPVEYATKKVPFKFLSMEVSGLPSIPALGFVLEVNEKTKYALAETLDFWNERDMRKLKSLGWDTDGHNLWKEDDETEKQ